MYSWQRSMYLIVGWPAMRIDCSGDRFGDYPDVDPGDRSRVNESSHPARLGRGLEHETHLAHSRADHPQAQNGRAADRPGQDRRRRLLRDRGDATDLPPLTAAVRWHEGPLGSQVAYAPGGSSTRSCRMTTTTHSHQHWTDKGGHVCLPLSRPATKRFTPWAALASTR
jgi:hypothetical protein